MGHFDPLQTANNQFKAAEAATVGVNYGNRWRLSFK